MPSISLHPLPEPGAEHHCRLQLCLRQHHGAALDATVWKAA